MQVIDTSDNVDQHVVLLFNRNLSN